MRRLILTILVCGLVISVLETLLGLDLSAHYGALKHHIFETTAYVLGAVMWSAVKASKLGGPNS
jgi:imidazoleglycerol phosphate dehydratase HisB